MQQKGSIFDEFIPYLLIAVFSFGYIFLFGTWFFRDFSIIFDGGLRVWYGQVPYRDFFIPTGPMIYYLQGLFNFILEPGRIALLLHASVINTLALILFFRHSRKYVNVILCAGFTILLHFFYHARLVNPWYDQTALLFYFAAQVVAFPYFDKPRPISIKTLTLISFFCLLSIFSKQDIGALGSLFIAGQLIGYSRRSFRNLGLFVLILTSQVLLVVLLFNSSTDFSYWFNYGQPPHSSRADLIFSKVLSDTWLLQDFRLHTVVLGAVFVIVMRDYSQLTVKNYLFVGGLSVFSILISITSGQGKYSSLFFIPLIAVHLLKLIFENRCVKLGPRKGILISYLVGWVVIGYMTTKIFANLFPVWLTINEGYTPLQNSSYAGYKLEPELIQGIEQLKTVLQKGKDKDKDNGSSDWFLNMSSYTFLYKDLNIEPPRGMHLYYHSGVTVFEKDYLDLKVKLEKRNFRYILLQEMATGFPSGEEFVAYLRQLGYRELLAVDTPKSGVNGEGRGSRFQATLYELQERGEDTATNRSGPYRLEQGKALRG